MRSKEDLNADYLAVTQNPAKHFVCPVTLRDEDVELAMGHILNEAIDDAPRLKVWMRRDLDNYFGHSLENDWAWWLQLPDLTPQKLIHSARRFKVRAADGSFVEGFYSSDPNTYKRFQTIGLFEPGKPDDVKIGYLRQPTLDGSEELANVRVERIIRDGVLEGAAIKAAFMTLFHYAGYAYALSSPAEAVRKSLCGFFENKNLDPADHFSEWIGCVNQLVVEGSAPLLDSLRFQRFIFHVSEAGFAKGVFAVTCLFQVRGRLTTVSLPWCHDDSAGEEAMRNYQAMLAGKSCRHGAHLAFLDKQGMHVASSPLAVTG